MIGSSLLNAGIGLMNAHDQKRNAAKTLAAQQENFGKLETAAQPYLGLGNQATANLSDPGKNFETSPGYNFRLNQGTQSVLGSTALNGLLRSGSAVKALNNYAQGMASDEYGKWTSQQQANANIGTNGLNALSGAVNGVSNALNTHSADLNAATKTGYDALGSGLGGVLGTPAVNNMFASYLAKIKGQSSGGSSYTMNNAPASTSI